MPVTPPQAMLYTALLHYPILDRSGAASVTSVTNLDMHDIARAATTYGLAGCFVVHPSEVMRRYCAHVLGHWRVGEGLAQNPTRRVALSGTELAADLGEVADRLHGRHRRPALFIATHARPYGAALTCGELRRRLREEPEQPFVLVFGTGHGLHPELIDSMDILLEPIRGVGRFNHLSVRSAVAIYLDRLCSPDREAGA